MQHGQDGVAHCHDVCGAGLAQYQANLPKTHARSNFVIEQQLAPGVAPGHAKAAADYKHHAVGRLTLPHDCIAARNRHRLKDTSQ